MKIEDFWEDRKSYYISFLSTENVVVNRLVLLSPEIEKNSEVEKLIYSSFGKVKKVLRIEEWDDALLFKEFVY